MTKHESNPPAPPRQRPPAPPMPPAVQYLPSDVVGQLRSLRSRLKVSEEQTQQARKEAAQYKAERDALEALVNMARDAYIEENSDGETDCVTPYDWYGISIKEGIKP